MTGASEGKDPSLEVEREWFRTGVEWVIGIDEVGRGAIAGPVAVGAFAILSTTSEVPEGLRDSKLLSEKRREAVGERLSDWGAGAVGYGEPHEIDRHGISLMLGQAARRALLALHRSGVPVDQAQILLDGSHDWLTPVLNRPLRVLTRVGADRTCASVAAASVHAKLERDRLMRGAHDDHPHYSWKSNKGYGSKAHYDGIAEHGLTVLHRRTWIRSHALPQVG